MRHSAFFEALARAQEQGEAWEQIAIGYYLIRAFEDWCEIGPKRFSIDEGIDRIREKIDGLSAIDPSFANVFRESLRILTFHGEWRVASVVSPIMAYASLLEAAGHWALAGDVYGTIADRLRDTANKERDTLSIGFARRKQAFALRNLGEFDTAELRYLEAIRLADSERDARTSVYARIGLSFLYKNKGNFPAALDSLTTLLSEYTSGRYGTVEGASADIHHCRGAVRHDMKEYDLAILDFFAAYQSSHDVNTREMTLSDLAASAGRKGYHDLARKVFELIIHRSTIALRRQCAIVNMMFFAASTGDQLLFTTYKNQWQPDICDPVLNASAWFTIAQAAEHFGTKSEALAAYEAAVDFAAQKHVHHIEFDALKRIDEIRNSGQETPSESCTYSPMPSFLSPVADALFDEYLLAVGHSAH